jgi:hypothetical protein
MPTRIRISKRIISGVGVAVPVLRIIWVGYNAVWLGELGNIRPAIRSCVRNEHVSLVNPFCAFFDTRSFKHEGLRCTDRTCASPNRSKGLFRRHGTHRAADVNQVISLLLAPINFLDIGDTNQLLDRALILQQPTQLCQAIVFFEAHQLITWWFFFAVFPL